MRSWGKVDGRGKGGAVGNFLQIDTARHRLEARRAPKLSGFFLPESPTQWPPEGPRRVSAKGAWMERREEAPSSGPWRAPGEPVQGGAVDDLLREV